jgi:transposase
MARSLSQDLRSRIVAAVAGGLSRRAAAERFGVSIASCCRGDGRLKHQPCDRDDAYPESGSAVSRFLVLNFGR